MKWKTNPTSPAAEWFKLYKKIAFKFFEYIHRGWIYPSPLPPFQDPRPRGYRVRITPFFLQNASRSRFATIFLLRLLLFFLPKPFRDQNLQIFDPPRLSKSSIFIETIDIFEVFQVLRSKALVDHSWRPFWPHLGSSWDLLGASWELLGAPLEFLWTHSGGHSKLSGGLSIFLSVISESILLHYVSSSTLSLIHI